MSDTEIKFDEEELEQISELLKDFENPNLDEVFNPLKENLHRDIGLPVAAPIEPEEFPEDEPETDEIGGEPSAEPLESAPEPGEIADLDDLLATPEETPPLEAGAGDTLSLDDTSSLLDDLDLGGDAESEPISDTTPDITDTGGLDDLDDLLATPEETPPLESGADDTLSLDDTSSLLDDLDLGGDAESEPISDTTPDITDTGGLDDLLATPEETPPLESGADDTLSLDDTSSLLDDLDLGGDAESEPISDTTPDITDTGDLGGLDDLDDLLATPEETPPLESGADDTLSLDDTSSLLDDLDLGGDAESEPISDTTPDITDTGGLDDLDDLLATPEETPPLESGADDTLSLDDTSSLLDDLDLGGDAELPQAEEFPALDEMPGEDMAGFEEPTAESLAESLPDDFDEGLTDDSIFTDEVPAEESPPLDDLLDDTTALDDGGLDAGSLDDLPALDDAVEPMELTSDAGDDIFSGIDTDEPLEAIGEPLEEAPALDEDFGAGLGDGLELPTEEEPGLEGGMELEAAPETPVEDQGEDLDIDFSSLEALDDGGVAAGEFDSEMESPSGDSALALDDFDAPTEGGSLLDASDLADMGEKAKLASGIGDEFTDEELANLRSNLVDYPSALKTTVIDMVVNEKLPFDDQRVLVNMIIARTEVDKVADYIQEKMGFRPDTTPAAITRDGVPIIYAEGLSPEEIAGKRKRKKIMAAAVGLLVTTLLSVLGGYYYISYSSIRSLYERGLDELTHAIGTTGDEKTRRIEKAELLFNEALTKAEGKNSVEYLNRYGMAYLKVGKPEMAFEKLYGRVSPDYGEMAKGVAHAESAWSNPARRAPLIRYAQEGDSWPEAVIASSGEIKVPEGEGAILTEKDNIKRRVEVAGAYIVDRLRDQELKKQTITNLARFHSYNSRKFIASPEGQKYKNDALGIDYYRLILSLMNKPDDITALDGIARIYYNRREFASATRQYNKLIDKHPMDITGHAGLLNTYLEMVGEKEYQDPRYVIDRHRQIQKLDLEKELPIYTMSKLAGFYIGLDPEVLRIKYQVDPVNQLTGLSLEDNTRHLLELIFRKEEKRAEELIVGTQYGEGFYQRGRFLLSQGEATRALQQFQNAHRYDNSHYLAVNAMGEYYKKQLEYVKARQYFETAINIYNEKQADFGDRIEDETLLKGDIGKIYYNLGSLTFLRNAGNQNPNDGFIDTRIYPIRETNIDLNLQKRLDLLQNSRSLLATALENNIKDKNARIESIYWMGWIDYVNADFEKSLEQWNALNDEYEQNYNDNSLLMARGNSSYYTGQNRSALGYYQKVINDLELKQQSVKRPLVSDRTHQELFLTLSAVYNNTGAVYEKEYQEALKNNTPSVILKELESSALQYYYKAVSTARKIEYDNEIARSNYKLALKLPSNSGDTGRDPLLDDWISPLLTKIER